MSDKPSLKQIAYFEKVEILNFFILSKGAETRPFAQFQFIQKFKIHSL
jgi:hypothetical protein